MVSPKRFVLVELLDRPVVSLLLSLRTILSDERPSTSIHITLRGPYRTDAIWRFLKEYGSEPIHDPILISGVGRFSVGDKRYAYLKARSEFIDRLLLKPDYPKLKFGTNPHVTIYEGINPEKSIAVETFLKAEGMYFFCKSFRLVPYETRQLPLVLEQEPPIEPNFDELVRIGKVRPGILARARALAGDFST